MVRELLDLLRAFAVVEQPGDHGGTHCPVKGFYFWQAAFGYGFAHCAADVVSMGIPGFPCSIIKKPELSRVSVCQIALQIFLKALADRFVRPFAAFVFPVPFWHVSYSDEHTLHVYRIQWQVSNWANTHQ